MIEAFLLNPVGDVGLPHMVIRKLPLGDLSVQMITYTVPREPQPAQTASSVLSFL